MNATLRELRQQPVLVAVSIAIMGASVVPIAVLMVSVSSYSLNGPADLYAFFMSKSPLALVFPLVVGLPYSMTVASQVSHRYLLYTRTRDSLTKSIHNRLSAAAVTGFMIGFMVPLIIYIWAFLIVPTFRLIAWHPEVMGLSTVEQIREAQSHAFTFAQLLDYGHWVFGLSYSTFAGLAGALFTTATVACVFMVPNRFLALATPWVVNLAVYFLMAVLNLAPISPNAFFPFNLTQGPMWEPFVPLSALAGLVGALLLVLFNRARVWDAWQ